MTSHPISTATHFFPGMGQLWTELETRHSQTLLSPFSATRAGTTSRQRGQIEVVTD